MVDERGVVVAIDDAIARISTIQARFGITSLYGFDTGYDAEFTGLQTPSIDDVFFPGIVTSRGSARQLVSTDLTDDTLALGHQVDYLPVHI